MQLKGLVRIFTILLILISIFQLSFTWKANNFEKKVGNKALQEIKSENPDKNYTLDDPTVRARTSQLLEQDADQVIYKPLGIGKYTYQEVKENQLNLGLDLQGGMNVVLEVSLDELIRSLSNNPKDVAMNDAIKQANLDKANSQANLIELFVKEYTTKNPNAKLANLFAKGDASEGINYSSSNADVEKYLKKKANSAIKQTYSILQKRIDKFGVAQPSINLDEDRAMISVELAGVQNPERVRKYLQSSAKLEFWEVYTNQEFWNGYGEKFNEAIAKSFTSENDEPSMAADTSSVATSEANEDTTQSTSGLDSLMNSTDGPTANTDDQNLTEEESKAKFPVTSILTPSVSSDGKSFLQVGEIGYIRVQDTSQLNKYLNSNAAKGVFPGNMKFLYGRESSNQAGIKFVSVYAIKTVPGRDKAPLGGDRVTSAKYDLRDMKPEVTMSMDPQGTQEWARLTEANVGRPVAIALDDIVYSAPNVNEKIPSGNSQITMGGATEENIEQAQDLANILNSGKLEAPARIIQEQVVGPTLGREATQAGAKSFLISFIVIFILMLVYYNTGGWVANIALVLNLLFTIGILSYLGATLTLPGIAGLVLTIGMAVDTNVLIFERIKEELRTGKTHAQAVIDGYRRSLAPVLDAHFTTLITAIILFIYGLGPVLGFATTQILGILLSLFCGIFVSRLVTDMYMKKGKHFNYFSKISEKVFQNSNFNFIGQRKRTYVMSAIVLTLGIASFFHGFDYGVEFSGGRSYTIRFDQKTNPQDVRSALKTQLEEFPVVKTIGEANQLNITTSYLITSTSGDADDKVKKALLDGLVKVNFLQQNTNLEDFDSKYVMLSNKVLPTISDDLKKGAMTATILSLIFISLYIILRFRRWQYVVGTVFALMHDVSVILIVFSFLKNVVPFSLEIDQHFIAAILTVIGFSMNDTVIVFDRIREYFSKQPKGNPINIINDAINNTLSRTVMTALTVFLTVLILFIFGGEATRGFAFAMLIGIVTGTYSSIFVASPVLVDLDKQGKLGVEEDKEKRKAEILKQA